MKKPNLNNIKPYEMKHKHIIENGFQHCQIKISMKMMLLNEMVSQPSVTKYSSFDIEQVSTLIEMRE